MSFVGSPDANVGAVQDEMRVLGLDWADFAEYYEQLRRGQFLQAIGRPRSHRYPEQKFIINFIGTHLDLDWLREYGIRVLNCSAFEICPEAGSDRQVSRWKIKIVGGTRSRL
ncbi:MAG: hypothetical protein AB4290_05365 [Spirulina sp.]